MRRMLGMLLPFMMMETIAMAEIDMSSRNDGGKLKRGLKFRRVYAGDKPYLKPTNELGRNEPCHCGSGKKHKKCCMGTVSVTEVKS